MSRLAICCSFLAFAWFLVGCDPVAGADIINNSDTRVCISSPKSCVDYNDPGERINWGLNVCRGDDRVTLTLNAPGGAVFYQHTATCDEWDDAGPITIEGTLAEGLTVSDDFDP